VFAIAILLLRGADGATQNRTAAVPTFNRDVAPIIFSKCAGCHRPQQATPMSLLSFAEARPWAQAIRRRVAAREMPPWSADPRFGRFRNDLTLTDSEIATVTGWVDGGAPEGVGAPPAPPLFAEGWNHPSRRPPDVILEMPEHIDVPAQGQLPTLSVYSPLPPGLAAADSFVEALQLIPGNVPVTHHASISMRTLPPGVTLGAARPWPGGPLLRHVPVLRDPAALKETRPRPMSGAEVFSPTGTSHLVFYFPGNHGFAIYPPGVGKRVRGSDFVEWSVHYTPIGTPERDRQRAGLWLTSVPPRREVITLRVGDFHIVNDEEIVLPAGITTNPGHAALVDVVQSCEGVPCVRQVSTIPPIPPRADNWKITAMTPFQRDATLYSAYPHGHLRLRDMTYVLTYPDGREETLLSVPKYDFNWQLVYVFAEPVHVPAGSTVKAIGHFDNSRANRSNPAPDSEVKWSEQSWDEMFNGFLDLSIDDFDVRLGASMAEPAAGIVTAVGCAVRHSDGSWTLAEASETRPSAKLHADAEEIAASRMVRGGQNRYQLAGVAEFVSTAEQLTIGDRARFTDTRTANATGQLKHGTMIGVKAVTTTGAGVRRLNLVSVWPVAATCGRR
jgi:hypothetical protein